MKQETATESQAGNFSEEERFRILPQRIHSEEDEAARAPSQINVSQSSTKFLLKQIAWKIGPILAYESCVAVNEFTIATFLNMVNEDAYSANFLIAASLNIALISSPTLNIVTSLIGKSYGSGDTKAVVDYTQQGWLLGILLCIPTWVTLLAAKSILTALGQDKSLLEMVDFYNKIYLAATPAYLLLQTDIALLKATGKELWLIPYGLFNLTVNAALSALLIFASGNDSDPNHAIMSAAISTTLQLWLGWVALKFFFFRWDPQIKSYQLHKIRWQEQFHQLLDTIKPAWPLLLPSLGEEGVGFTISMMIGGLGKTLININSTAQLYLKFFKGPSKSISAASQICVSQQFGAKNYHTMKNYAKVALIIEAILCLIPTLVYLFAPLPLARWYMDETEVADNSSTIREVFFLIAITKVLDGLIKVTTQNLNGIVDTLYPSTATLAITVLGILPLATILCYPAKMKLTGINLAVDSGLAFMLLVIGRRWYQRCNELTTQRPTIFNVADRKETKDLGVDVDPNYQSIQQLSPTN